MGHKRTDVFTMGARKHVRVAQLEESGELPAEVVLGRWVRVCRARGEARGGRVLQTEGAVHHRCSVSWLGLRETTGWLG